MIEAIALSEIVGGKGLESVFQFFDSFFEKIQIGHSGPSISLVFNRGKGRVQSTEIDNAIIVGYRIPQPVKATVVIFVVFFYFSVDQLRERTDSGHGSWVYVHASVNFLGHFLKTGESSVIVPRHDFIAIPKQDFLNFAHLDFRRRQNRELFPQRLKEKPVHFFEQVFVDCVYYDDCVSVVIAQ